VSRTAQYEIRAAGLDQVGELAQAEHEPSASLFRWRSTDTINGKNYEEDEANAIETE
jgi:hypothetical protein